MTFRSNNFTDLLYFNPGSKGFNPVVSATVSGPASINEGLAATFNVVTWNVADNSSVFYKVTSLTNLTQGRFDTVSGPVAITDNRGSFSITVSADTASAAGAQSYVVTISRVLNGTALSTISVDVNDSSQGGNKVISLSPDYIALQGGNTIPNQADSSATSAIIAGIFDGTLAQNGTMTLTSMNSGIYLPYKNIKTIGMWIKLLGPPLAATRYLLDSRIDDTGGTSGYLYSGGYDRWSQISINGAAPIGSDNWSTLANTVNTWQYVVVISTNTHTDITLFNRWNMVEPLGPLQVGWIDAWDYALSNSEITTAYQAHLTDYTINVPNALQITVGSVTQGGMSPNYNVTLSGVPNAQWAAIRAASSYVGKHGDNTTFSMTYISDDDSGSFTLGIGTQTSFQADSFWYVP